LRAFLTLFLVLALPTLLALSLTEPAARESGPFERHASMALRAETWQPAGDDDDDDDDDDAGLVRFFVHDPFLDPAAVIAGAARGRLLWQPDPPAFPGDLPGSLTALYDSSLPAGLFGFALPRPVSQDDPFSAAAVFVIEADGFEADPQGFFQISWGLWNSQATGLNRTGNLQSFAADSFELLELNWFPNVSPLFGGPFLSPVAFGTATGDPPDAFSNSSLLFGMEARLPLDVPLLCVLRHRPEDDALSVQLYEIVGPGRALPVNGAVAVVPLDGLVLREYALDTLGLTLWHDGFGGPEPALRVTLVYHALVFRPGRPVDPEQLF